MTEGMRLEASVDRAYIYDRNVGWRLCERRDAIVFYTEWGHKDFMCVSCGVTQFYDEQKIKILINFLTFFLFQWM